MNVKCLLSSLSSLLQKNNRLYQVSVGQCLAVLNPLSHKGYVAMAICDGSEAQQWQIEGWGPTVMAGETDQSARSLYSVISVADWANGLASFPSSQWGSECLSDPPSRWWSRYWARITKRSRFRDVSVFSVFYDFNGRSFFFFFNL